MLWRKGWWETRWRLLTILGLTLLLIISNHSWTLPRLTDWAAAAQQWWPLPQQGGSGWEEKGRVMNLLITWPGYVWWMLFRPLLMVWPVYAIIITTSLIKSSYPLAGASGAAALFTVSLPVSRRKALLVSAAVAAVEMILIALAPPLTYSIAIRLTDRWFPLGSAVIYALLLALGGMVFVAFTFLLMAIFNSQWKVVAIGISIAFALLQIPYTLGLQSYPFSEFPWWHIYHLMSGETYFRHGQIPWFGLFASLAASASMMCATVRIYERRDF